MVKYSPKPLVRLVYPISSRDRSLFLLRNVDNKMAEAVRPVKKKKKAKKSHVDRRERLEIPTEDATVKERGIASVSKLYLCRILLKIKFHAGKLHQPSIMQSRDSLGIVDAEIAMFIHKMYENITNPAFHFMPNGKKIEFHSL